MIQSVGLKCQYQGDTMGFRFNQDQVSSWKVWEISYVTERFIFLLLLKISRGRNL